ncbi:MAG: helix-turn-helix transcriptional regulator [Oscillospiraceae bacterium]|nr:helix-turn-helix transcriptional regulator [Oscillospiraceae bacterium]
MSLSSKINELRKQKGLSIDELCQKSGIPKGTLSKITAGITTSPTLDTVCAIANALECTLDDLSDKPIKKSPAPTVAGAGVPPTREGLKVGLAYDQADDGIRASVRKLLDINPDGTDAEEFAFSLAACGGGLRQESLSKDQISLATKIAKETMAE